jgi:ribosomal-protein-alanine N-acetyltransferase
VEHDGGPDGGERWAIGPVGPRVYLRTPRAGDAAAFAAAAVASAELHRGWATPPVTREAFLEYLERIADPTVEGFLVLRREDDALLGRATLSQIFRGGFQNAYLGYEAMAGHERRGYMTEGVRLVLGHAFGPLGLHRVEANVQPTNVPSLALVRRVGFRHEGFSPRYLYVAGAWRDHERFAILADEFDPAVAAD